MKTYKETFQVKFYNLQNNKLVLEGKIISYAYNFMYNKKINLKTLIVIKKLEYLFFEYVLYF